MSCRLYFMTGHWPVVNYGDLTHALPQSMP